MSEFILTNENYYSPEADKEFMSVHQYLDFIGSLGRNGCEERAMKKLSGEYKEEVTDALLIGSYVDAYFEGTLDKYKEEHPECFTNKGTLYAKYNKAEKMIKRCVDDDYFMLFMNGTESNPAEHQRIFTAELFGCKWKCKLDSYIPGIAIVDLKTTANLHKAWRVADYGYASFVEYWGYITQLAVYQKIVDICTGEHLPCYIAAVTKEDTPEIKIIEIDDFSLNDALEQVKMNMPSVLAVKNGEYEPTRCGHCDYCKATEKLSSPINYRDLIMESE